MIDIAIYGGGIVGAAIARDAALRGLKVKLIEKYDYASGASSKSSKLAHGGLRYLETYQFGLVQHSLSERDWLLTHAPEMVKPLPFIFPLHHDSRLKMKLALSLYDWLAPSHLPKHRFTKIPELNSTFRRDIQEGYIFYDAQLDDARLVFANLADAKKNGASFQNYSTEKIEAKVTIQAEGAFSPLSKPTKGVHLVLPQVEKKYAFILRAPQDQRVFFVIPWKGYSLVGTTDTPFSGNPQEVSVTKEDIKYLLEAFSFYFPKQSTTLISSFAGLRPLIKTEGLSPSQIPRDHLIKVEGSQIQIVGGKYTTFRLMAEEAVDEACKLLHLSKKSLTKNLMLNEPFEHKGQKLTGEHPYTDQDVLFSLQEEQARHLSDWFYRRTEMGYTNGLKALPVVASLFRSFYQWNEETLQEELKAFELQIPPRMEH